MFIKPRCWALGCLLSCLGFFLSYQSAFSLNQPENKLRSDSIKIIIENFTNRDPSENDFLGKNLVGVFHILLGQYQGFFEVIPRSEMWRVFLKQLGKEQKDLHLDENFFKNFDRFEKNLFTENIYSEISPNFILNGAYSIKGNEIIFDLGLKGYPKESSTYLPLGPFHLNKENFLNEAALMSGEIFKSLVQEGKGLKITMGGFYENEGTSISFDSPLNERGFLLTDLVLDNLNIYFKEPLPKGTRKIWVVVTNENKYFTPNCHPEQFAEPLKPKGDSAPANEDLQVILVGSILESKEKVSIRPTLCLFEKKGNGLKLLNKINGNKIQLDLENDKEKLNYGWIAQELSFDLQLFIKDLIGLDGKWNKEIFPLIQTNQSFIQNSEQLIKLGKDYLASTLFDPYIEYNKANEKNCSATPEVSKVYFLNGLAYQNITEKEQPKDSYADNFESLLNKAICFYEESLKRFKSENPESQNLIYFLKALVGKSELQNRKWLLYSHENQELINFVIDSHREVFEEGFNSINQVEDVETKIALKDRFFQAIERYGNILLKREEFEQAEKAFEILNKQAPHNLKFLVGLGVSLMEQKKFSQAVTQFNKVIELAEKDTIPNESLVERVKFWVGKLGKDLYYEKAKEKIAIAYENYERKDEFSETIEDALNYLMDFIKLEDWKGRKNENYYGAILQVADLYTFLNKYDESIKYLTRLKNELREEREVIDPSYLMMTEYFLIKVKGLRGNYGKNQKDLDYETFRTEENNSLARSVGIRWDWKEYFKMTPEKKYQGKDMGIFVSALEDRMELVFQHIGNDK